MFGQTFGYHDLIVIGLLVVLEGVLSIDNALVLGLLARRLPRELQGKALTYGLVGAFVFRFIAIATAAWLLHWTIVKLLGGGYLIYISIKHFLAERAETVVEKIAVGHDGAPTLVDSQTGIELDGDAAESEIAGRVPWYSGINKAFWSTVFVIEMTDIAFAVDSIVAAIGVVGPPPLGVTRHPKLWVIITGGFLGVIVMRFAAVLFIRLLERFPRFEMAAYLLVLVIGGKLVVDWAFNTKEHPHRIDFHDINHPEFWVFWILMLAAFCVGFLPSRKQEHPPVQT